ncbi:sensor histidine kinase [Actinoallomurus rhizosphaericola]|uniref:sensor histidine kinase n=1 Tax=Actinoallomurus rhizosphaericola TaxID=2952536 RepID=UPI0020908F62|nr:sensor histidine kinase [Actinoallomurus rhizosphaericola]MCO5992694.1 sensor histidine kinase [Actinoallomurus rhizosphaericola]
MNATLSARLHVTVRLLMYARLLLLAMAVVLVPDERFTTALLVAMGVVAVLSLTVAQLPGRLLPLLARRPLLLAADAAAAYLVLESAGAFGPFFLFSVVTSALAGVLYEWRGLLFVCALQVLLYDLAARSIQSVGIQAVVALPVFYPVAGCVGVAVHRLLQQYAEAEEARREAEVVAASAEERLRLARDMHDSLAKTLHGVALSAAALPAWVRKSPDRAEQEADNIAAGLKIAVAEARELIAGLRDGDQSVPLAEAVRRMTADWAASTGIAVEVGVTDDVRLPPVRRAETLAILKEALTNVERHAAAGTVRITLTADGRGTELSVRDDGKGFTCPRDMADLTNALVRDGHYGVVGMAERARRVGGLLTLTSSPGNGSTLTVSLPEVNGVREAVR